MKQKFMTIAAMFILMIISANLVHAQNQQPQTIVQNGVTYVLTNVNGQVQWVPMQPVQQSNQFTPDDYYSADAQNQRNSQRQADDVHNQNVANTRNTNAQTFYTYTEALGNTFVRGANYLLANKQLNQNQEVINYTFGNGNKNTMSRQRSSQRPVRRNTSTVNYTDNYNMSTSGRCTNEQFMGDMNVQCNRRR